MSINKWEIHNSAAEKNTQRKNNWSSQFVRKFCVSTYRIQIYANPRKAEKLNINYLRGSELVHMCVFASLIYFEIAGVKGGPTCV